MKTPHRNIIFSIFQHPPTLLFCRGRRKHRKQKILANPILGYKSTKRFENFAYDWKCIGNNGKYSILFEFSFFLKSAWNMRFHFYTVLLRLTRFFHFLGWNISNYLGSTQDKKKKKKIEKTRKMEMMKFAGKFERFLPRLIKSV